jgi:hypothetical protein
MNCEATRIVAAGGYRLDIPDKEKYNEQTFAFGTREQW